MINTDLLKYLICLLFIRALNGSYYKKPYGNRRGILPDKVYDATNSAGCGKAKGSIGRAPRIVNGNDASYGEYPWQVVIHHPSAYNTVKERTDILGGGTLINRNWVISAAHNFYGAPTEGITIRVGEFTHGTDMEPHPHVERNIAQIVIHPKYNSKTFEYDAVLVKLDSPVTFQDNIQPICLYSQSNSLIGRRATATGWGHLFHDDMHAAVLQEVSLPIIKTKKCEKMFRNFEENVHLGNIFLCAGYRHGKFDSCSGDSGGPLQMRLKNGRWALVGIISWGYGCARENRPGVYTRVSELITWINNTLIEQ